MKKLTILTIFTILVSAAFIPLTVLAAPLHADVDISADDTTKTGLPGSVVQFTLTLHNNTAGDLTLAGIATTAGGWTAPTLFPAAFTVATGADQFVTVNAPIPADATNGQNDVVTVTFTDGAVTASIMLTVEALVPVVEPTAVTGRPLLVVESYSAGGKAIQPGAKFNLGLTVKNIGAGKATNVVAVFTSAELLPQETGGVVAVSALNAGKATTLNQPMLASEALWGATYGTVTVAVTYSDLAGASYTENFTVLVNLAQPVYSGSYQCNCHANRSCPSAACHWRLCSRCRSAAAWHDFQPEIGCNQFRPGGCALHYHGAGRRCKHGRRWLRHTPTRRRVWRRR